MRHHGESLMRVITRTLAYEIGRETKGVGILGCFNDDYDFDL